MEREIGLYIVLGTRRLEREKVRRGREKWRGCSFRSRKKGRGSFPGSEVHYKREREIGFNSKVQRSRRGECPSPRYGVVQALGLQEVEKRGRFKS